VALVFLTESSLAFNLSTQNKKNFVNPKRVYDCVVNHIFFVDKNQTVVKLNDRLPAIVWQYAQQTEIDKKELEKNKGRKRWH
jgi:hypothetical protein